MNQLPLNTIHQISFDKQSESQDDQKIFDSSAEQSLLLPHVQNNLLECHLNNPFSYLYKQFNMIELTEEDHNQFPIFKKKRKLDQKGSSFQIVQQHFNQEQKNKGFQKLETRSNSLDWITQVIQIGYNKNNSKVAKIMTNCGQYLYFDYTLLKNQNPKVLCKYYQSKLSVQN